MTEPQSTQHDKHTRGMRAVCVWVWLSLWLVLAPAIAESRGALAQNAAPGNGSRESTILPTDTPVNISAERLSFNYKDNTYTAKGNVTVGQGNTRLRADSITYEGNTGALTAAGKVIVRSGSDVVEAEKVTIFLRTGTGVLFNGKLFLTKNNVFLQGKKLERISDSTYHVEDGSFTTCNGPSPDWRITGKDLDVTLEGYGKMKHGFFYIKNIPVFYIPWLIYPAKRQRQSGFLMPSSQTARYAGLTCAFPCLSRFRRA